jgi:hypothetical protein
MVRKTHALLQRDKALEQLVFMQGCYLLNKSNQDRRVTFVEYWEENTKTGKIQRFSWITDLDITGDNVYLFMCGARARWKIENETFNTLKN